MHDELTDAQAEELHNALPALKLALETQLEASKEAAQPVELDQPIGRVSRIDAIQQQQMVRSSRRNLTVRLQQVKAALAAVRVDEYGECRRCGEDIGYERLKARPEAPLCLVCQSAIERDVRR